MTFNFSTGKFPGSPRLKVAETDENRDPATPDPQPFPNGIRVEHENSAPRAYQAFHDGPIFHGHVRHGKNQGNLRQEFTAGLWPYKK